LPQPLSVRTEIRFYGREDTLADRPDIVILNPNGIDIGLERSKGYKFDEYYTIIELKLRRETNETDDEFFEKIKQDISKLKKIARETTNNSNEKLYYVLAFDIRKNKKLLLEINNNTELSADDWIKWVQP
jgi:hypothetical protein